jgi:hypothetical protein
MVAHLAWNDGQIQQDGPASLPDALERDVPLRFVGNGFAIAPFLVRLDIAWTEEHGGSAHRLYFCWFFGASQVLSERSLWQFEAHDGMVHGTDSSTNTIYVIE